MRIPRHMHERAYLSFVRGGSFSERMGRRSRFCAPGMFLITPPGDPHTEDMNRVPVVSLNVEFGPTWLATLVEHGFPLDHPTEGRFMEVFSAGSRILDELRHHDADSALAIECVTWELLVGIASHRLPVERAEPRWMRHAREEVDFAMQPPSLASIAQRAGVHPVHFATTFRRLHGCSLGEYSRRRRLIAACALLREHKLSLSQIAQRAGFTDQAHFTRTLKRFTGMTPREYRTFLAFKTD